MYTPYIYSLMLFNRPKLFNLLMEQLWYKNALIEWYDSINGVKTTVIELGCGPGVLLPYIAQSASTTTGIDSAKDMISFFNKHHPKSNISTQVASALEKEAFSGRKYNVVIAASLINVLEDKVKLIQNCIDHTAAEGSISFFFPTETMTAHNARQFSVKHKLPALSSELLITWAKNAKKINPEQLIKLVPPSLSNSIVINNYLDQMASSLTFNVQ